MGRLIDPGLGDVWDRITILELKRIHQPGFGEDEFDTLHRSLPMVRATSPLADGELMERLVRVALINALVWAREDEIRLLNRLGFGVSQEEWTHAVAEIAVFTRELMDRKHVILAELNGYREKVRS